MTARPAALRALVGVLALYGLLLQAFFAAATPRDAFVEGGLLCAAETHDDASGTPAPAAPAAHDHACCTAAHPDGAFLPPLPAVAQVDWPSDCGAALRWRRDAAAPLTGPPRRAHTARGPPVA